MNTKEFIAGVEERTCYDVKVSENNNELIEIIAHNGNRLCNINVAIGLIRFLDEELMDMDDSDETELLNLLQEYSLTKNRELPNDDVTISKSEYKYLNEKAERLDKLESVLNDKSEYKLPF